MGGADERPAGAPFVHRVRVGYVDTDQGGVVHHSVYLRWLEQARVEYLREYGIAYRDLEYDEEFALPVAEAKLKYRLPAKFDEELDIETRIGRLSRATIRFDYVVRRAPTDVICEAEILLACIKLPGGRLRSLPEGLRSALAER